MEYASIELDKDELDFLLSLINSNPSKAREFPEIKEKILEILDNFIEIDDEESVDCYD